jgi:hypothetical protein
MQQNGRSARAGLNLKVPPRLLLLRSRKTKRAQMNPACSSCTARKPEIYIYAKHNRLQLLIMQDAAVKFQFSILYPNLCGAHLSFGDYGNSGCLRLHQDGFKINLCAMET